MVANALTAYLHHNKSVDIYIDASDFQSGTCIVQDGWAVIYFSCKLSKCQQNYTVTEKEMLFFVATLEHFQGMHSSPWP